MKKKWIVIWTLFITLSFTSITFASEQNSIVRLEEAKEAAIKFSRLVQNMNLTVDKIFTNKGIADDVYEKNSLYKKWHEKLNYLYSLQDRLAKKEGDLSSILMQITRTEMEIAEIKKMMDSGMDDQLAKGARDLKVAYDNIRTTRNEFEKELGYQVEKLYTNILKLEDNFKLLIRTYDLQNKMLNLEKLKKELGMSSQIDVDKLEVEVTNLNETLKALNNNVKFMKWQLNDLMGQDHNQQLVLVKYDIDQNFDIPTYDDLLKTISNEYQGILQIERDIKNKSNDKDDEEDGKQKKLLELEIEELKLKIEDEKFKLKNSAEELLNDLKAKQEALSIVKSSYAIAKQSYDWDKTKFELGMISKMQLDASELTYQEALNKKTSAGYDYFLAKRALELAEQGILVTGQEI